MRKNGSGTDISILGHEIVTKVTQASGVGEFRIAVDGPVSADISQSFLLPKGLDLGRQQLGVQLKAGSIWKHSETRSY